MTVGALAKPRSCARAAAAHHYLQDRKNFGNVLLKY